MTLKLFCKTYYVRWNCDGEIRCPWISPHDEANCSQQCLSSWYGPILCACNKPGNMTCKEESWVCYREYCKFYVLVFFLFYFYKRHNCCKIKQSEFCFESLLNCDVIIIFSFNQVKYN